MCESIKSLSVYYYYIEVLIWVHSEQHLGLLIKMRFVRHVFLYTVQWIREEEGSQETHRGLSTFESVDKPRPRATDFLLAAACRKRERVHNLHQKPTVEWYFHLRTYFTARGVCKANPPQPLSPRAQKSIAHEIQKRNNNSVSRLLPEWGHGSVE